MSATVAPNRHVKAPPSLHGRRQWPEACRWGLPTEVIEDDYFSAMSETMRNLEFPYRSSDHKHDCPLAVRRMYPAISQLSERL